MLKDRYRLSKEENIFLAKKTLVASVYSSALLEGINVTYPDTQTILDGYTVSGMRTDDVQKILNLRNAWRYVLERIDEPMDVPFLCEINARVSYGESLAWGELRTGFVGIGGTSWKPPVPVRETASRELAALISGGTSVTERALDLWLWGMRAQLFWDGNKRTSNIAANHVLIGGLGGVLSVRPERIADFNRHLTDFYDSGNGGAFKIFLYENCVFGLEIEAPPR